MDFLRCKNINFLSFLLHEMTVELTIIMVAGDVLNHIDDANKIDNEGCR